VPGEVSVLAARARVADAVESAFRMPVAISLIVAVEAAGRHERALGVPT
jgi:hypothetical protein